MGASGEFVVGARGYVDLNVCVHRYMAVAGVQDENEQYVIKLDRLPDPHWHFVDRLLTPCGLI